VFDLKIIDGLLFDGEGSDGIHTNIAIKDGLIVEIGPCSGPASKTLSAKDHIVTPGFIDLHTHYDGQISWDEELKPSVNHGVTTALLGNCGVGFAPCRAEDRDKLIRLMEGVEDIPGTALHEGMDWQWESFPEYMDAIDAKPHTIDFAVMVPVYNEPANDADIATMRELTREALEAGALGFSIGRSDFHKSSDGAWTPGSEAGKDELVGIAAAFKGLGHGVLQVVNDFDMLRPGESFETEFDLMEDFFRAGHGHKGSMSLMERDFAPEDWKNIIRRTEAMNADGLDISFQVAPRAIGSFVPPMVDMMIASFPQIAEKLFKLDQSGTVDYEQTGETSLAALARKNGVDVWEQAYDMLLEDDGKALIYYPVYNYYEMNYDNVLTMMQHPKALPGLSDGGAHVGTICDASFPTYLLSHWTRDRIRKGSDGIALKRAVQMLTADGADYLGLTDRGRLKVGMRADINIIDYDGLDLAMPEMVQDLPAGGQRLIQPVKGYMATFVKGEQVIANDEVTAARPGRLVRGGVN